MNAPIKGVLMLTFNSEHLEQDGKVLVKFGADWCQSCKAIEPMLEELEVEGYSVYSVNVDFEPDMVVEYKIRNVPTMLIFEDKVVVERIYGAQPKAKIKEFLDS